MIASEAMMKKAAEREALRGVIQQWNANRLDLFELSEPNEELEFHGVMRFYFQDSGQKVATKCIRVASDATVTAVIGTLIEKFRPDMRMLSIPEYALYEIHENGEERRLEPEEKPLLVQLNWHKDDREGRFLLKRIDDATALQMPSSTFQEGGSSFKRKLSKREKKQLKKQEKVKRIQNSENDEGGVAGKLYNELPETRFTRSISNPEAVMRRRRQQKLERKLQQFRSKDGGPDTGGTLKIYGESLCGDVPYKTLLLSVRDTTVHVLKEMLIKYGLDKEDAHNYCLVQVNTEDPPGSNETILDEDECPLAILMNHPSTKGSIMFHVRRRPADYHPRKRKKKPMQKWQRGDLDYRYENGLPFFLELNPDGSEILSGTAKRHILHPNVTEEVGCERTTGPNHSQSLQLFGPNIQPRHCIIGHTDGLVTVTPCSRDAETYVNGQRIYETTILQSGAMVKFGRIHNFRFLDPTVDERGRPRADLSFDRQSSRDETSSLNQSNSINGPSSPPGNYETTFDVDGNVETVSLKDMDSRSQRSIASSKDGTRVSNYERYPRGSDPILPAVLELREDTEEAFLHAVIIDLDPSIPSFKLAPTYVLYLTARYRASTHYRPELTPTERAHRLTVLLARVASMIQHVIQERYSDPQYLAFWMANASELLHFLKCDRHVSAFSLDAQDILAESVQNAFRNLVACEHGELAVAMSHFLSDRDDDGSCSAVLQVLSSTMALLRQCRVNAALTIQLFSQLFHFINMWAFNKVVTSPTQPQGVNYCNRVWGSRLKNRLCQLEIWAERQGLELAANCHLARIIQVAYLLEAPKYNANDLANLSSICFKLNSLQLKALLRGYQPSPDEPRLPVELIDNIVRVAENVADELARSDGREVKLEEDCELELAFLLPEDGYSCDVMRGVHQGLAEFIQPLQTAGLCRMSLQHTSSGLWTIYMADTATNLRSPSAMSNRTPMPQQPLEVETIKLHKSNNGMGLSIVAAKGAGQDRLGIYIKSVVPGGAADVDGRLQAGDQLVKVDGQSLVGITQEKAAEYLVRTGPVVTLEVAKQGAIYHGLATLLSQPSPVMARGPRRMSERDIPSRVYVEDQRRQQLPPHTPIQSSKSVPSLHSANQPPVEQRQQEFFNPGYSRTSSTNSIPQSALRSRSNQNLNDNRPTIPNHQTSLQHINSGPALHPAQSTPSLHQQNFALHSPLSQHQVPNQSYYSPEGPRNAFPVGSPNSYHPNQNIPQPGNHYTGSPGYNGMHPDHNMNSHESERFYQNLSIYKHQEITSGLNRLKYNMDDRPNPRGSQSSLHRPVIHDGMPQRDRPASAYLPAHAVPQGMQNRSQSSRDMLRQEAKLQEMGEEVRRRDLRGGNIPRTMISPGNAPDRPTVTFEPPPVAPKPVTSDEYRESPPPPPPPVNTHPLLQKSPSENRYQASMVDPPRGYYQSNSADRRQYPYTGTNPWEREEKEKEQARRREAARQWRDQQISELSGLTNRTPQQEEQLRALKLEREFERRAEEVKQEDEDEGDEETQESIDRVQGLLRMAQQQNGPIIRPATASIAQMRLEEVRRQHNMQAQPPPKLISQPHRSPSQIRFENLSMNGSPNNQYPNGYYHNGNPQRLDNVETKNIENKQMPAPPERNSSYQIMFEHGGSRTATASVLKCSSSSTPNNTTPTKRVSFIDPNANLNQSTNTMDKIIEDPNNFINEAETMLNSPRTPDGTPSFTGNTPGVIGAQEVYRDPRQRLLAEQKQNTTPKIPGPEKLSFKEKMKMFAMETGEDGTPRDKVKISRAQRDIDNISSPPNNNNNANTNNNNINNQHSSYN